MPQFRKKPIVIEATQWHKNGDHPKDESKPVTDDSGYGHLSEGKVVRYFRHPDIAGGSFCKHCAKRMHDHGWIDTLEGDHIVCPGDYIITGIAGEVYPCKPAIFLATYEAATPGLKKASEVVAEELYNTGLLFEINRRVLHPLGLAMSVQVEGDGTVDIAPLVRTSDPEGIHYWPETLEEGFKKYQAFMKAGGLERMRRREEVLGYIEQEIPSDKDAV